MGLDIVATLSMSEKVYMYILSGNGVYVTSQLSSIADEPHPRGLGPTRSQG